MSFVLSIVQPARRGSKYGTAHVTTAMDEKSLLRNLAREALKDANPHMEDGQAERYAMHIVNLDAGAWSVDLSTGLRFRIDSTDRTPHPCPCCGALVLPEDHPCATLGDAYCVGCIAFKRDVPKCLPDNSAHMAKEGA